MKAQLQKQTHVNQHIWLSMNATTEFNSKWSLLADFHLRNTWPFQTPGFVFGRLGLQYQFPSGIKVAGGYGNLFSSPTRTDLKTWADEHRIYQQFQYQSNAGKINILNRLRIEQRWKQHIDIIKDQWDGNYDFCHRFRYLLSLSIPLFSSPKHPALVLADEVFIQTGPAIGYNTFDQNRFFIGYKQQLSKTVSFDLGYMRIDQQKATGYQYDLNHTIRLFFYGNFKSKQP